MALNQSIHPNIHANIYIPTYQSRQTCVHACACLYLTELLTPGTFTFFFSPKRPSFNTWLDGFANTSFVDKVFSSQPLCQRSLDQFQSPLGGQIEPTSNMTKSCKNQWQLCDSLLYFSFLWCGWPLCDASLKGNAVVLVESIHCERCQLSFSGQPPV